MQDWLLLLLAAAGLGWLGVCVVLWGAAFWRIGTGQSVLPSEPREKYPGGLAEVLLAAGVYLLIVSLLRPFFVPDVPLPEGGGEADVDALRQMVPMIMLNSAATATAVAVVLAWAGLQGFTLRSMGLVPTARDLAIGVVATIMLLPPVFVIQAILASLIEYSHPLLNVLQQPQPLTTILAMAVSSVLVAPLTEEFFFRGLFQGWLSRIAGSKPVPAAQAEYAAHDARALAGVPVAEPAEQPVEEPQSALREPAKVDDSGAWWPVVVSSLFFALVHAGQGPAPITLFFLALGIGYLYRQTGRIWAGVVVHLGLNGLTTTVTILTTNLK